MPDYHKELTHFLTAHVSTHGADHRSLRHINDNCDRWLVDYPKIADKVRHEAIEHWKTKGGK